MAQKWSENAMEAALAEVRQGVSIRKAASKFSVPKSTLADRVTGKVAPGSRWGKAPVIDTKSEEDMLDVAKERAEMGIGFSKGTFLRFAGALAEKKATRFKMGRPSDMWWRSFKARHPTFSLRTPEATATSRHDAMSRVRMAKYFAALKDVLDKHDLSSRPQRLWNMDETGVSFSHKPCQVIAKKGTKTVHGKSSNSREMITVIACGNATGEMVPPHFIVPGKTKKKLEGYDTQSTRISGSPLEGANFSVSDSGWTKDGIGRLWFTETFIPSIGMARPQVLIFDGHGSHNNLEFIELARQENIILVELPSHTSQWTQPFDRAVFKSLKSHWNAEVDAFISNTGIPVGHGQFLKVFGRAWGASMTPSNIRNGFKATGIAPYNPGAIPNDAYSVSLPKSVSPAADDSNNTSEVAAVGDISCEDSEMEMLDSSAPENVSSITLSVPIGTDNVLDLPLVLDQEGNLRMNDPAPVASPPADVESSTCTSLECTAAEALKVIESAVDSKQLSIYNQALERGVDLSDSMFQTWRMYKQKTDTGETPLSRTSVSGSNSMVQTVANEICPIPTSSVKPKKRKNATDSGYFVLSADEIYAKKKAADDEKKRKLIEKEQRKLERENKRLLKLKEKEQKHRK